MEPLLEIRNLEVSFPHHLGREVKSVAAVRDISLSIGKGEVLGLVGESGSGKSVTSLAIMRLLPPSATVCGSITFESNELTGVSDDDMRGLRGRSMAMIFQEPMTALNPVMRVGDQVAEAVTAHSNRMEVGREREVGRPTNNSAMEVGRPRPTRISKSEAWQKAIEALTTVAIPEPDRRARDYPHQLSGGQRQRVMIAMAIVNRPQLLIADEPTTALDVTVQAQILDLLAELRQKFGLAMLFISHDLAVVSQVADRVAVMYAGQIVETGPAREMFRAALHPYTRGLMNSVPTLRTDRERPLRTIEGTVPAIASLPPGCSFEPRCGVRIPECAKLSPPLVEVAPGHWVRCPVVTRP